MKCTSDILTYFSSESPFNTVGALERAKLAVEKHYAVVGVLEDINTTLTVLENYIPRFFQGATDVYYGKLLMNCSTNLKIFSLIKYQFINISYLYICALSFCEHD